MDLDDYEEYMLSQSDGEDAPRSGDGAGCFVWLVFAAVLGLLAAIVAACG